MSTEIKQVGGDHYAQSAVPCIHCGKPLKHWDVYGKMAYLVGGATKYLWRHAFKGASLEDLRKGLTYYIKYIKDNFPAADLTDLLPPVRLQPPLFPPGYGKLGLYDVEYDDSKLQIVGSHPEWIQIGGNKYTVSVKIKETK